MRRKISMLAAFSLISGCAAATAGGGCPPLVSYTADMQRRAASELRALPRQSPLAAMIVDYGKMRAACRVAAP